MPTLTYCAITAAAVITILWAAVLVIEYLEDRSGVTVVPEAWADEFGAYARKIAEARQAERARRGSLYRSRPEMRVPALVSIGGSSVAVIETDAAPVVKPDEAEAALRALAYENPAYWIAWGDFSEAVHRNLPALPDDGPGAPDEDGGAESVQ